MLVLYLFESMSNIRYFGLDILPLQGRYKLYLNSNLIPNVVMLNLFHLFSLFHFLHLVLVFMQNLDFLYLIYLPDII